MQTSLLIAHIKDSPDQISSNVLNFKRLRCVIFQLERLVSTHRQ